ncbi:uncharacterized protein MKK02DRAFT_41100 [Dioszegia hungarica]|uniref:Uncharacterized protein n=1 Tax=Dioszegia hungarica TaxID=4972 RepID=A0AA38LRP9_9TREE|nr:uncharacterized protein MKK02DRAFT_41100 [Dioszegia hungarica]KAI9632788.1 hypothetical protein MKK02DRAFT_41100 [Dioszegia hungarica]
MLRWILQRTCFASWQDPETDPLLGPGPSHLPFPSPDTILTAPRPRPSPLSNLPHTRLSSAGHTTSTSPETLTRHSSVGAALASGSGLSSPGGGGGANGGAEGKEKLGGISRFYSQRMRPLARPSLPNTPTPAHHGHHRSHTLSSTPFTPYIAPSGSHTVPTSPAVPLHYSPPRPAHPSGSSRTRTRADTDGSGDAPRPTGISRSISAPLSLSLHLLSMRIASSAQSPSRSPVIQTPQIEGFAPHQLPNGAQTDPRSVMIFRGRPRSATTLSTVKRSESRSGSAGGVAGGSTTTSAGGSARGSSTGLAVTKGLAGMRSVSDEGVQRLEREGRAEEGRMGIGAGLEWTGRRGRSPGPTRIGMSRRTTLSAGMPASGVVGSGGVGMGRQASPLGLGGAVSARDDGLTGGLSVPPPPRAASSGSSRGVSPDMCLELEASNNLPIGRGDDDGKEGQDEEEGGREDEMAVVKKDLGLAEMFRPLGHRQSRSVGRRGGGRGSSGSRPPGRARRTTNE